MVMALGLAEVVMAEKGGREGDVVGRKGRK